MNPQPTVFIIDDETIVHDALSLLLVKEDLHREGYGSARAFIDAYEPQRAGCLVLDICMPGMDSLELQQALAAQQP